MANVDSWRTKKNQTDLVPLKEETSSKMDARFEKEQHARQHIQSETVLQGRRNMMDSCSQKGTGGYEG